MFAFCEILVSLLPLGALAHLVERLVRNQKVVGSSPICSTNNHRNHSIYKGFRFYGTENGIIRGSAYLSPRY